MCAINSNTLQMKAVDANKFCKIVCNAEHCLPFLSNRWSKSSRLAGIATIVKAN